MRPWMTAILLFGLFAAFLSAVQFSTPNLVDNDGYYHVKMAYLMRTQGLKPRFDWLPLSVLNPTEFVDHHFLFHVALIPFTFGDLRVGAKVATVIFPALAFTAIWWLLRGQRVPLAGLWSLGLLAISEAFIFRMSSPRAQSLSLAVLALALHWLLNGRFRLLLPLAFAYVWFYNAFPLIFILAIIYCIAQWLTEGHFPWPPLAYTGAGMVLGLVVNPYFPANILFLFRHILPKITDTTATSVGSEWFPYNTVQIMDNSGLALLIFLLGIAALGFAGRRVSLAVFTALLSALAFGTMLFKARRFIEYFPPFVLIFTALAVAPLLDSWLAGEWGMSGLRRLLDGLLLRLSRWLPNSLLRGSLLAGFMLAALLPAGWINLSASRTSVQGAARPYERYAAASQWLIDNTPQDGRVFQTDWDDFPRLFFYNTHNTYLVGLDPVYMQLYDADLYDLWVDITQGKVDQPSVILRDTFGCEIALTDLNHGDFIAQAEADPGMVEVYRDEFAIIYRMEE